MPSLLLVAPVIGLLLAIGVPLAEHVARERNTRTVIALVQEAMALQAAFQGRAGGYASGGAALAAACASGSEAFGLVQARAAAAGYRVAVCPSAQAHLVGNACDGTPLISAYLVTAEPVVPGVGRAVTGVSDGGVFVFYDGVAPTEHDIARGLPTPLDRLNAFRIP
jgi:hypothetical protein